MPYAEIQDYIVGTRTGCKNMEVARRVAKERIARYNSTWDCRRFRHAPENAYMVEDESKNIIYIKRR